MRHVCFVLVAVGLVLPVCVSGQQDFEVFLRQAFELHQQNQFSQAVPLLLRAHKLQPQDYFVNLLLGIDMLRTGHPDKAVSFLRQASHLRPGEEFPYGYLGEAQAGLGHFADAAEAYARAAGLAPQSPHATVAMVDFSLARFATLAGRLRSSQKGLAAEYRLQAQAQSRADVSREELLRHAASLDADAPGIWSELALAGLSRKDLANAEEDLRRAWRQNPNDLQAWIGKAQLAALKGDWKRSGEDLNAVYERSTTVLAKAASEWPAALKPPREAVPTGPAAHFFECLAVKDQTCAALPSWKRSPSRRHSGSPKVLFAEQRWERVTSLPEPPPGEPSLWFKRGVALAHVDDCRHAIPALERGLSDSPTAVEGMYWLSLCYAQEAGAIADRVAQTGEDESLVHMMRGDVLLRLKADAPGAITEYQAALQSRANDPAILERLAEAQFGAGHNDGAREYAHGALILDAHRPAAMRTLAKIALQERNYATALPYLRELAHRDPRDLATQVELATACAQTGAFDEALARLGPALKQGYPDEKGSLHYTLGTVLRKLGRTPEAEQAFAAARQLSDAFQNSSRQTQ